MVGTESEKDKCGPLRKSMQNLPKSAFSLATQVNGYDVMAARTLVVTEAALTELTSL